MQENQTSISASVKKPPVGNTKHRQKEKRISASKNDAKGPFLNSLGSMNAQGTACNSASDILKKDVSSRPAFGLGDTTKNPSVIPAVPHTEYVILEVANSATTFLDSVLSLCSKSLISCGESDSGLGGELMFLDLVKLLGLIQAKYWADALHVPNQKSYALLAHILYGSRLPAHDPLASFTATLAIQKSSKHDPSIPLPLPG